MHPRLPSSAALAAAAWVLTCAAAVLAGLALTLAPAETARAWPLVSAAPGAARFVAPAAACVAAAAALALAAAAGHVRARQWQRPFAELILLHPLLLAGIWFVLGADGPGPVTWITGAGFAAAIAFLARRSARRPPAGAGWSRRWLVVDAVMIAVPALVGLALGGAPAGRAAVVSAAAYPVYALVQLTAFVLVPATRLRAMGLGPRATAATCAAVFALLHWPHPLVMLLTAVGAAVWTFAWLQGRPLWHLALVMGLAATTTTQFLPEAWHGHMRVGPHAVRVLAVADLVGAVDADARPAPAWLESVYPGIVGRGLTEDERLAWQQALERDGRVRIAWRMQGSPEYADLVAAGRRPAPPPAAAAWTDLPEPWRGALTPFGTDAFAAAAGGDRDAVVAALYRTVLDRDAAPAERAAWSWDLDPVQRTALAGQIFAERMSLAHKPFADIWFPPLRIPPG